MQRLDLQFYSFFMIVLSGALFGLLFDLLRTARGYYRPSRFAAGVADLLFWLTAGVALSGGLFYGNWGDLRLYVLFGLILGVGLYLWLASSVVVSLVRLLFRALEWFVGLMLSMLYRLVWAPLVALATLVWGALQMIWGWIVSLVQTLYDLSGRLFSWLVTPLIGPYRFCRLHYLLWKRRWKRQLRHWLLGPPRQRR